MKQRLHPIELTLMIVAALALTSGAVALHTQSQLAEKVVRLHVLANSDSEEDQALKLKVRDAVLAAIPLLLYNGQRGRKSKWYQWGYYLIYPIHFMVLYAIELLIR